MSPKHPEERPLTLAMVGRMLRRIEQWEGAIVAHRFAQHLDYDHLAGLALAFLEGPEARPENDPSLVPERFLLLPGMAGPEVRDFQRALRALGIVLRETGRFDRETLAGYRHWLAGEGRVTAQPPVREGKAS